jgi:hypothetical protein
MSVSRKKNFEKLSENDARSAGGRADSEAEKNLGKSDQAGVGGAAVQSARLARLTRVERSWERKVLEQEETGNYIMAGSQEHTSKARMKETSIGK